MPASKAATPIPLVGQPNDARRQLEKDEWDRIWKPLPPRPNGTIVTGALSETEIEKVVFEKKLANTRLRRVLESVPLEIWGEVIRHATETYPFPFSIHDFNAIPSTITLPEHELYQLYRRSIMIKLRLTRVCQAWRALTKPYLYEFIWVTSLKEADALGQLLKEEEDAGLRDPRSSSWWIRSVRLDSCRPGHPDNLTPGTWEGEADWGTLRVISKCPRLLHYRHSSSHKERPRLCSATLYELLYPLTVFKDGPDRSNSDPFLLTGGGHHSLSFRLKAARHKQEYGVKSLDWQDTRPWSLVEHLGWHHSALPRSIVATLQHLTIRGTYVPPKNIEDQEAVLSLPDLHTLSITDDRTLARMTKWELPALRNLTLGGNDREAPHHLGLFLEEHGPKIETLELLEFGKTFYDAENLGQLDLDLTNMCPKLTTLNLSLKSLQPWPARQSFWVQRSHPSVQRLGLLGLEGNSPLPPSVQVLVKLGGMDWKRKLPALKTVQDMSMESDRMRRKALEYPGTREARLNIDFWEIFMGFLIGKGVTLLDWKGNPVVLRKYSPSSL